MAGEYRLKKKYRLRAVYVSLFYAFCLTVPAIDQIKINNVEGLGDILAVLGGGALVLLLLPYIGPLMFLKGLHIIKDGGGEGEDFSLIGLILWPIFGFTIGPFLVITLPIYLVFYDPTSILSYVSGICCLIVELTIGLFTLLTYGGSWWILDTKFGRKLIYWRAKFMHKFFDER